MASLLYSDVLWRLINDKWHAFGRRRFFWFAAVSLVCQMLLTLSLCRRPVREDEVWRLQPGERCDGVLVLLIVPINLSISTQEANSCFCASLVLMLSKRKLSYQRLSASCASTSGRIVAPAVAPPSARGAS